jgi:hypothetical protein
MPSSRTKRVSYTSFAPYPETVRYMRCTKSSWRVKPKSPYGPGGYNRCLPPGNGHDQHKDEWGNVWVLEPKFRVLRHEAVTKEEEERWK